MHILILFAHPTLEKSRVNSQLARVVADLPGVTFQDLYEAYPYFDINVRYEQQLLEAHDLVVFQHPFFWYSTPPIMKQWEDLVLEHGWAYGSRGTALHGKKFLSAITSGGTAEAYRRGGYNRYTIRELLVPLEQTAHLCGMEYLPPFVIHGTHRMDKQAIMQAAEDYRRVIEGLRDEQIDLDEARKHPFINSWLDAIFKPAAEVV